MSKSARQTFIHDFELIKNPRPSVRKAAAGRIADLIFAPKGSLCPICGERVGFTRRTAQQNPKPSEQIDYINTHTCTKCPWLRVINDNGHVLQSRTPDPTEES